MFKSMVELRERAWKFLESARALCESDPDTAAYLGGYSLELMLKQRYASIKNWTDLPGVDVIKARGSREILSHDLNELLVLARAEVLKSGAMLDVEWDMIANWTVDQRYQALGSQSAGKVRERLNGLERAFHQLADFALLDQLQDVESKVRDQVGPFRFLALVRNHETEGWYLLASSKSADFTCEQIGKRILASMVEVVDHDLCSSVAFVSVQPAQHPLVKACVESFGIEPLDRGSHVMIKSSIVIPYGMLPDLYILTSD
ncbi:MAG TPA: hypothetical protein DGD08_06055 [Gemmatimonas aurantiaca]|uniref:HEPN domain-containing protein n=1 Tax=Gemmatimonas aurantiaca TaxID=173480 RepID=A0A3D4V6M8_9BACT|nr:hypothetical protein [Gemmatimonas aurantiaca]HCT56760.1 hypothetical protein [Gemmatimonas aurantiaca]